MNSIASCWHDGDSNNRKDVELDEGPSLNRCSMSNVRRKRGAHRAGGTVRCPTSDDADVTLSSKIRDWSDGDVGGRRGVSTNGLDSTWGGVLAWAGGSSGENAPRAIT